MIYCPFTPNKVFHTAVDEAGDAVGGEADCAVQTCYCCCLLSSLCCGGGCAIL